MLDNSTYKFRVAQLAKEVCEKKLGFFKFLDLIGGDKSLYETGIENVDELIFLLEHWPMDAKYSKSDSYGAKVIALIEELEKS